MTKNQRFYLASAVTTLYHALNHAMLSESMFNHKNESMGYNLAEQSQTELDEAELLFKNFVDCEQ